MATRYKRQTDLKQAYQVLDDLLYNAIYDLVLQTHREEKIARANSAAIAVERLATEQSTVLPPSVSTAEPRHFETAAAIWYQGETYIKGNPLLRVSQILCGKCGLPRLLYPTTGEGAVLAENGIEYCKQHPYISKSDHDIHGVPFPTEDIKVPRKNAKAKTSSQENGSLDLPSSSTPPPQLVNGRASFPNFLCSRCSRYVGIRDYRKHLMACMGISSRSSGRAAILKITGNSVGPGSQNGSTPPGSRRGTPALPISKTSPNKRDREASEADNLPEISDEDEQLRKKKKPSGAKVKQESTNKPQSEETSEEGSIANNELETKQEPSESSRTLSSPS
jgi:hypothetical protein